MKINCKRCGDFFVSERRKFCSACRSKIDQCQLFPMGLVGAILGCLLAAFLFYPEDSQLADFFVFLPTCALAGFSAFGSIFYEEHKREVPGHLRLFIGFRIIALLFIVNIVGGLINPYVSKLVMSPITYSMDKTFLNLVFFILLKILFRLTFHKLYPTCAERLK